MDINTPKELAENISNFVNVMGNDKNEEFIVYMGIEHRTLQQAFTRLCVQWLEHMASLGDNRIDLRNQDSRDLAQKMLRSPEVLAEYGDEPSKYLRTI